MRRIVVLLCIVAACSGGADDPGTSPDAARLVIDAGGVAADGAVVVDASLPLPDAAPDAPLADATGGVAADSSTTPFPDGPRAPDAAPDSPDATTGPPDSGAGPPDARRDGGAVPMADSGAGPPDAPVDAPLAMSDAAPAPDAAGPDTAVPPPDAVVSPPDAMELPDARTADAPAPPDAAVPDARTPDAPAPDANVLYAFEEHFPGSDGSGWPAPWDVLGGVAAQTVQSGRGRLVPVGSGYSLARMGFDASVRDVEVSFRVRFEDTSTQGVGFYVRQNGGWLQNTSPHGGGYAVFLEGFDQSRLGVWTEIDGQEQAIGARDVLPFALMNDVTYAVRFRVTQQSPATTRLQARVWRADDPEPSTWFVERTDGSASLQNVSAGFAVDSWSTHPSDPLTAGTLVDDIVITGL